MGMFWAVTGLLIAAVLALWSIDPGHPVIVRKGSGVLHINRLEKEAVIDAANRDGQIHVKIRDARTRAQEEEDRRQGKTPPAPLEVQFPRQPDWFVASQDNRLYFGAQNAAVRYVEIDKAPPAGQSLEMHDPDPAQTGKILDAVKSAGKKRRW